MCISIDRLSGISRQSNVVIRVESRLGHSTPGDITSLKLGHGHATLTFFLNEREKQNLGKDVYGEFPWIGHTLVVTQDALFEALRQVETLGKWMEESLFDVKYGRPRMTCSLSTPRS